MKNTHVFTPLSRSIAEIKAENEKIHDDLDDFADRRFVIPQLHRNRDAASIS